VDPPPPSGLDPRGPPELDRKVAKALAKDCGARYQSAEQLLKELRTIRDALGSEDVPTRTIAPEPRGSSAKSLAAVVGVARRPLVFLPAIVMALAAIGVSFWLRATPYRPSSQALYWYEQGTAALRDGTYYKATKTLERALKVDDKFPLAHARLAEAWAELDYADKANREILQARSLVHDLSPLPPLDALYLQTITHVVLREFGPAIENYQKIVEQAPDADKSSAYVDLGRAQEKNDETEKALESYAQAARLAPQDATAFLRLGILYGMQQNTERAREAFKTAEGLYQILNNFEGLAEVFYQRGFLFKNLDMLPEARAQLEQVLKLTKDTGNQYQQIRALQILSTVSAAEGNARQAEQQATQAIALARENGIENQATNGLIELGNSFLLRGEYDVAEKYYKQALDFAQRNNGRMNEASALVQLGSLRSLQRNTDEALRYIQQALPFYQQGGYRKWLSQALTLLGRVQFDRGDEEAALRAFNEQLQLGEQAGDLSQIALSHQEIGSVLVAQEQYPEALRHFDLSYEIKKSLNARVSIGYSLTYRSNALWQIGRYEEARAALDEASSIAGREGDYKQLLAEIHMIAGRLELSEWHFQESKSKSQQALELAGTQYKDTAVLAKYTLGLAQNRSGARRAGSLLCDEAVGIATSTGDPRLLSTALLASAESTLGSGDAQRALEFAVQARESFVRFGQQDSEWRAWLVAAQAKQRLGEAASAREYAANADAQLSNLEQKWGPEAYNGYLARPDIQHFRKQLGHLLNP
jgi:tetratricopeptide (TPR) repeat protein